MRRPSIALVAFGVLVALAASAVALGRLVRGRHEAVGATMSATALLGAGDTVGFERADRPRAFHFPEDHGPHPAARNEWWYFTGNLDGPGGRRFGYELTIFRTALAPTAERPSEWGARDAYMAHFAITDVAGKRFLARDRFARGALGLAGAVAPGEGWRVWLEDWRMESERERGRAGERETARASSGAAGAAAAPATADRRRPAAASPQSPALPLSRSAFWPIHLVAADTGMAVDLTIAQGKPPVLQGENGLSRKGQEPGDASYYYSLTRMPTSGLLTVDGTRHRVSGASWMDREWSTSALGPDEVGWDWFALQLSDGRDLMLYRIRRRDGGISPYSAGTLVERDGRAQPLSARDALVDVLGTWASDDGARYPAHWRLRVPRAGLDLDVRPVLADQELNLNVRYWEGAVDVRGTAGGTSVGGRGYVELTGYAGGAKPAGAAASRTR